MNISNSPFKPLTKEVTFSNCDKEPIHIIGKIQNHGVLITCKIDTLEINRCSKNTSVLFDKTTKEILGASMNTILNQKILDEVILAFSNKNIFYKEYEIKNIDVTIIVHKSDREYVFEFELNTIKLDSLAYQMRLTEIVFEINSINDLQERCNRTAAMVKEYFAYDRVMIYKFDAEWNGAIISEAKEPHLESWLGLHYPSTDIPQQARQLFLKQGVRIICDVHTEPLDIINHSKTKSVLDMSNSELRYVAPVHIEYLKNMRVNATLTAAIIIDNKLWGLIACHHYSPKFINYYQRLNCKFLTQVFATKIQLDKSNKIIEKLNQSSFIHARLIDQINTSQNIIKGLTQLQYTINDLTESFGAAIYLDQKIISIGDCPTENQILAIILQIKDLDYPNEYIYHTHQASHDLDILSITEKAAGICCCFLSPSKEDALIWFKPEKIQTIHWAGNPHKEILPDHTKKLSPRKSFAKWIEQQTGKSVPWQDYEIAEVEKFKNNLTDIITEREIKELNHKLKIAYKELESFSYSVSHDLRAPIRGIDGFANILKEEYYDTLDDFGKSSLNTIIESVNKMNTLIDDILEYSRLGRKSIQHKSFSLKSAIEEVLPNLKELYPNVQVTIQEELPMIIGDQNIFLLLLKNLIENAMKYSSKSQNPQVQIRHLEKNTFYIKDNGIGFDMKHKERIFDVFNRLVNDDEYNGSGIGLAIVKRIIDRHQGEIWVESKIDKGSTFYFSLNNYEKQ